MVPCSSTNEAGTAFYPAYFTLDHDHDGGWANIEIGTFDGWVILVCIHIGIKGSRAWRVHWSWIRYSHNSRY